MKNFIFVLLGIILGLSVGAPLSFAASNDNLGIGRESIIELTNKHRVANNLNSLVENEVLNRAATLKAQDMASKGYFSHKSIEGVSPWYWFKLMGYSFDYSGENLAVLFDTSEDIVNAWMGSVSHRENILGEKYTEIGIGLAKGIYDGYETTFVVQVFGHPKDKQS